MQKLCASLLFCTLIILSISSCKKDDSKKTACETKYTLEGPGFNIFVINRYNASGQITEIITNNESLSYEYKKNRVNIRSNGSDVYNISLESGRAVRMETTGSDWVQNITYDGEGRIKQVFIGEPDNPSNTYTYNYHNGNLDFVVEKLKGDGLIERTFSYEYSNIKVDSRTQSLQSYFGLVTSVALPVTLRGTLPTYFPSKMVYAERTSSNPSASKTLSVTEYAYTKSSDGKLLGVDVKNVQQNFGGDVTVIQKINLKSTCD